MDEKQKRALEAYSRGEMAALELRRRLGDATYGEVLLLLGEAGLPLPGARRGQRRSDQARPRMDVSEACRGA